MQERIYLISAVVTLMTFVLAIFGSAWLNGRGTDKRIEDLNRNIDKRIEELKRSIDARFDSVERRIDDLTARTGDRFVSVEQRLDRIERHPDAVFKPSLPPR